MIKSVGRVKEHYLNNLTEEEIEEIAAQMFLLFNECQDNIVSLSEEINDNTHISGLSDM